MKMLIPILGIVLFVSVCLLLNWTKTPANAMPPALEMQGDVSIEQTEFVSLDGYEKVCDEFGCRFVSYEQIPELEMVSHEMHNEGMHRPRLIVKVFGRQRRMARRERSGGFFRRLFGRRRLNCG